LLRSIYLFNTCSGNKNETCGGWFSNSVYSVCPVGRWGEGCKKECHCNLEAPGCNINTGVCSAGCQAGWKGDSCDQPESTPNLKKQYMGCWKDKVLRAVPHLKVMSNSLTSFSCMEACKVEGYTFAATQNGKFCYCGDAFSQYGKSKSCDAPCTGNSQENCGGLFANSVYSVCKVGFYGDECNQPCGHCVGRKGACQLKTGQCLFGCKEGWFGPHCDRKELNDDIRFPFKEEKERKRREYNQR